MDARRPCIGSCSRSLAFTGTTYTGRSLIVTMLHLLTCLHQLFLLKHVKICPLPPSKDPPGVPLFAASPDDRFSLEDPESLGNNLLSRVDAVTFENIQSALYAARHMLTYNPAEFWHVAAVAWADASAPGQQGAPNPARDGNTSPASSATPSAQPAQRSASDAAAREHAEWEAWHDQKDAGRHGNMSFLLFLTHVQGCPSCFGVPAPPPPVLPTGQAHPAYRAPTPAPAAPAAPPARAYPAPAPAAAAYSAAPAAHPTPAPVAAAFSAPMPAPATTRPRFYGACLQQWLRDAQGLPGRTPAPAASAAAHMPARCSAADIACPAIYSVSAGCCSVFSAHEQPHCPSTYASCCSCVSSG